MSDEDYEDIEQCEICNGHCYVENLENGICEDCSKMNIDRKYTLHYISRSFEMYIGVLEDRIRKNEDVKNNKEELKEAKGVLKYLNENLK